MTQLSVETHKNYVIHVNGRKLTFEHQFETARVILDRAGFQGTFCLAATHGESGKVIHNFTDDDKVDLREFHHFRATFCGPEVVS
jgi:hypothetical protein